MISLNKPILERLNAELEAATQMRVIILKRKKPQNYMYLNLSFSFFELQESFFPALKMHALSRILRSDKDRS